MNASASASSIVSRLAEVLGPSNVLLSDDMAGYLVDSRRRYQGRAICVARPASTEAASAVVRICAEEGVVIVPQGGNTGMCGGATPDASAPAVVVSLERMSRVRDLDVANSTITVDAGCSLASIQDAAATADKLFPMSLGSEGSCQIGGNIATNAGGTGVLRYGPMRDLVLGLEVVLPDGRIWNGLRGLRKDNTGYDLKHLFIGSEGTLGVITGAVLKLFSRPKVSVTALVSLNSIHDALALLGATQRHFGERAATFEVMSENEYALVLDLKKDLHDPLQSRSKWCVFIELNDTAVDFDLQAALGEFLMQEMDAGRVADAVLPDSIAQTENIWRIRHSVLEANLNAGAAVSHDTSVPVSRTADFVINVERGITKKFADARVFFVGHIGDGNIHVVAVFPRADYSDPQRFSQLANEVNEIVDDVTVALGGSISAEHGIGQSNRGRLHRRKDPLELEYMRQIKRIFDPNDIMNRGKLV